MRAGRTIHQIYISTGRSDKIGEIKEAARITHIPICFSDPSFFDSAFGKGHQGVAAEVVPKDYTPLDDLLDIPGRKGETEFFLILDCIEDPRNFGAILRVADAAGVHGIVIQSHRSVLSGPAVSKVSAGAVEHVPVALVPNIKHAIYAMKERGITIAGADAGAHDTLWRAQLGEPLALVIGSEGKGLRKTIAALCDVLVSIPLYGKINSLNVSVATGIIAFEILRQRMK